MAMLKVLKGPNEGKTFDLKDERMTVGRNDNCYVVLGVLAVSREHAVIRQIQGKYYIEDLKSRNGTFVNNKEVAARTLLRDNDKIKICDNILLFLENPIRPPLPETLKAAVAELEDDDTSGTVEKSLSATSHQVLLETQSNERLQMLLDISADLSNIFILDQLLFKIADKIFQVFRQADRAFIIFSEDGKLVPKVIKTRREEESIEARFSRTIINKCLQSREAMLIEDATAGKGGFDPSQSIADCRIRSVMCVPLVGRQHEEAFGVIQLDTQDRFKKFTEEDLKLLLAVAGQAAIAVQNVRMYESLVARAGLERDLRLAREIQRSFLPRKSPAVEEYEFASHYEAAQEVGGDYFDFIPVPNGNFGIMVGDVAGKGVPAALLMAKVASECRYSLLTQPDLSEAINNLNHLLQEASMFDKFVTLIACLLDPRTHTVVSVNAGHMPPMIYRKATDRFEDGSTNDQAGFPLGVVDGVPYESVSFTLQPGDAVILFTDGVSESKNKAEADFQMQGVIHALRSGPMQPKAMVERIVNAVKHHATGRKPHDDLTCVIFGRTG